MTAPDKEREAYDLWLRSADNTSSWSAWQAARSLPSTPAAPGASVGASRCQIELINAGGAYPRSCPTCGLAGKCHKGLAHPFAKAAAAPSVGVEPVAKG